MALTDLTGVSLLSGSQKYGGRVTGSLPNPNDLALIPILLPLAFSLIVQASSFKLRAIGAWVLTSRFRNCYFKSEP